jgi:hypothetical protein
MLAQERVDRGAGDRVRVKRGLALPSRERAERALAPELREDERAIGELRRKEIVLRERLEAL